MNPAMSAATAASLNRDMVICLSCSTDRRSQASYSGPNRNGGEGPDEPRDDHQVCPDLLGSEKPDGARIEAAVNREGVWRSGHLRVGDSLKSKVLLEETDRRFTWGT
jgi:hypothetical protein